MPIIFGLLGIGGYVLVVYIVKSIILSFYTYEELTGQILSNVDTYTAPIIAALICVIFSWRDDLDDDIGWYILIIGAGTALFATLPYSVGMVILCNLIWAGCVFTSIFRFTYFKKPTND